MRYLTKTRFKLGIDCPTKLFYTGKKEYPDQSREDAFLAALAEGGYQVGELARQYYPGGTNIETLDYNDAEAKTTALMKKEKVVLYEPAFRFNNLFIRVDILVKEGRRLRLIEVKSKSFDSGADTPFLTKSGRISSAWESYLQDVAFQKYVLENACPGYTVTSYFMMADKNAVCPVDGLNQKFRIVKDANNRKGVTVSSSLTDKDLNPKILIEVPVDDYVRMIHEDTYNLGGTDMGFSALVDFFADHYALDKKVTPEIGAKCSKCEFKCTPGQKDDKLQNGFKECWKETLHWQDDDFKEPSVLELWNSRKKDSYIRAGKVKLRDLTQDDIKIKEDDSGRLSASQRQWLQVEKVTNKDMSVYFDSTGMKAEMDRWVFPHHHIDFETSRVAIPFNKGRKPYEGIIFQFSHHIVHKDGRVEHAGEYLHAIPGVFPNYETVRELKKQLEKDEGTIFRYANHENSFLMEVYRQLIEDTNPPSDREDLCEFIRSITKCDEWRSSRCMVDLWDLEKKYYYNPATHGSNSIKQVLPAIMNSSPYLKNKYSKPLYGAAGKIKSLNYTDWTWVRLDKDGRVIDPYKLLPKIFDEIDETIELMSDDDELKEGGAAMTAYCRMQFAEMSDYEREKLKKALLKYCELDTFAMVMIYEAWREMLMCCQGKT